MQFGINLKCLIWVLPIKKMGVWGRKCANVEMCKYANVQVCKCVSFFVFFLGGLPLISGTGSIIRCVIHATVFYQCMSTTFENRQ